MEIYFAEKMNPEVLYFVKGSRTNGKSLLKKLMEKTGGKNTLSLCGDAENHVYFSLKGEIATIDKESFELFIRHGLQTKEIVEEKKEKFTNMFSLTAADALGKDIYLKVGDSYRKCKILDFHYKAKNTSGRIALKVEHPDGYEYLTSVPSDFKENELYF